MRVDVDYCRVSVDKTGAAAGVDSQHRDNVQFAAEMGLSLARTYVDNDLSAFSEVERPQYQRLLSDIEAGRVRSVTVWHANRLHRTTDEVNPFIRLARRHGVLLYSTLKGEAYNLERASGRKQLRDDTSEAEYESEHRGERMVLARKRQARNGDFGGGPRPFGWGVDSGRVRSVCVNPSAPAMDRVYEQVPVLDMTRHNEAEAAEIRRWASELLSGVSMAQLLRDLAERGVQTVAMTDGRKLRRDGKPVRHRGWNARTIRQILVNPRASGHVVYRGEIVNRNAYQTILPEDTRQALITLFADPTRKTSPGNTPKWLGSLIYQCGVCGEGAVMSVRRNAQGQPVYRCREKNHCSWLAERVDMYVENVLVGLLAHLDAADLNLRENANVDVDALRGEMIILDRRKREAAQSFALDRIDREQMELITATVAARLREIRAELDTVSEEDPLSEFLKTDNAQRLWDSLSLGRKREILRRMLTVTLPPLGRGHPFNRDLIQIDRRRRTPSPEEVA